jgi:hypothetical protein
MVRVMVVAVMAGMVMVGLRERGDGECRQQGRDDEGLENAHGWAFGGWVV